jgi:hypothetical protein
LIFVASCFWNNNLKLYHEKQSFNTRPSFFNFHAKRTNWMKTEQLNYYYVTVPDIKQGTTVYVALHAHTFMKKDLWCKRDVKDSMATITIYEKCSPWTKSVLLFLRVVATVTNKWIFWTKWYACRNVWNAGPMSWVTDL